MTDKRLRITGVRPPEGGPPLIDIECPLCGQRARYRDGHGFKCSYGHQIPPDNVDFECLQARCSRPAHLKPGWHLSCGRHDFDLTAS